MESKECAKCKEIKPLDQFGTHRTTRDGRRHMCKKCMQSDYTRKLQESNKKRDEEIRKKFIEGEKVSTLAIEYSLTPMYIRRICKGLERKRDTWKEFKGKLKEYAAYIEPLKNVPEPMYPIPERERLPKIVNPVTTYKLSDLPQSEQDRISKLFVPYRDSSGKTVTRI